MKIAIFSDSYRYGLGGLTQSVINFSIALSDLGDEVAVFTLKQPKIHLDKKIKIIYLKYLPVFNPTRYKAKAKIPIGIFTASRELKKFKPDIIHNHSFFGMAWLAVYLAKKQNIPIVSTCHVYLSGFLNNLYFKRILFKPMVAFSSFYTRILFNKSDLIFVPSFAMKDKLISYGTQKPIKVLSNGIDLNKFYCQTAKTARDEIRIIHVGRLSFEKNLEFVFWVFEEVYSKNKNIKLHLVGSGEAENYLKKLAKKMRIDKNVVFLGNKLSDDLVRCYCESDIFFSASKMETQGMVFLEAAACGLPLLGLRYMSVPEIIINNFNGFCRSENDFSELTDNLLQLIKGPDLRRQFSENSRKIAQSHDIKDIVLILQDIYRQVSKNFNNY